MNFQRRVLIVAVVTAAYLCGSGLCQTSNCAYPSDDIIRGRIGSILQSGETGTPNITLLETNTVCLAHSTQRDRYRAISLVVRYNCTGINSCPTSPAEEQFDIACDSTNNWGTTAFGSSSTTGLRTPMPVANLSTPLRDCAICYSPVSASIVTGAPTPDEINHCAPCSAACNQSLMRCTDQLGDVCCNVYQGSTCAVDCSSNFVVEDSTGVCVCPPGKTGSNCDEDLDCGELMNPDNGYVNVTTTTVGSVASYSCNQGYFLIGDAERTCPITGMWPGNDPTCGGCPENCLVCVEANKCMTCRDNYELDSSGACVPVCNVAGCISCTSDPDKCDDCGEERKPNSAQTACICQIDGCTSCETDPTKCDVCETGKTPDSSQSSCITGGDDRNDRNDGGLSPGAIIGIILAIIILAILLALLTALIIYLIKKYWWDKIHLRSKDLQPETGDNHFNPLYVGPNDLDDVDKGAATTPTNGNAVLPKPDAQGGGEGGDIPDSNGSE